MIYKNENHLENRKSENRRSGSVRKLDMLIEQDCVLWLKLSMLTRLLQQKRAINSQLICKMKGWKKKLKKMNDKE